MAAILTPTSLVVLQPATLKHPPSTAESTCPLPPLPTSIAWSAESNSVFISSATTGVLQYDLSSGSLEGIDSAAPNSSSDPTVSLVVKDRGNTVIYGRSQQIKIISAQTGKTAHTYDTHKSAITSLSLSNDSSLLASTAAHSIHVHNLTLASHTVLRGIPAGSGSISTCVFHPHSRTRLLVGLGTQLVVYDTTRPSGPTRVIAIDKDQKNPGPIVAITCSPFSKTLVAVACSGGAIGLVDLEKEKGLFRTVQMPAPLTCLSFSAEGAALYGGTENGKLLVLDLRALDQPPKSTTVSENGDRVIAISVQKKLKPGEARPTKPVETVAPKPLVQRDTNKTAPGARQPPSASSTEAAKKPAEVRLAGKSKPTTVTSTTPRRTATRTASGATQSNGSPAGRVASGTRRLNPAAAKSPIATRFEAQRKAFSPPKSPVRLDEKRGDDEDDGDISVQVENLLALPRAREPAVSSGGAPASAAPRAPSVSRASSQAELGLGAKTRTHSRTASAASRVSATESASAALPRTRSASSASAAGGRASKASTRTASGTSARATSPPPAAEPQRRRVSGSSAVSRRSRTPSPDLPGMDDDDDDGGPVTPIPAYKVKGKERAPLGLGTPEVDEWMKAGEANLQAKDSVGEARKDGKRVGFAGDSDSEGEGEDGSSDSEPARGAPRRQQPLSHSTAARLGRDELAMQVSPRRSYAGGATSWAPVPSPLRNASTGAAPPSPQARAAQDMLQALLRDALHDFRQETKTEIVGLHLDLIRMGGSWRREMREAMGEFAEEMRALREENRALREENERLRRGY